MAETPLIEVFKSTAVVLLRNGATVSDLNEAVRKAEDQVAIERKENSRV